MDFGEHSPHNLKARAAMHAALGDPHRLAIVEALHISDISPSDLGARLNIPSNLLAHHLEVLENAGLISRLKSSGDGRRRYLTLEHEALTGISLLPHLPCHSILFVCTQNSARSQLAAALWNQASAVPAESAGTHPAERVHQHAIDTAAGAGLDLSLAHPKAVVDVDGTPGLIITVCDQANEEIMHLDAPRLHWSVADPVARGTKTAFDEALATLRRRITLLSPCITNKN